ncbi:MAG: Asp-tRNA(Asn)/Glu-tRNA(Gln) amidotransferase subunit GatA [Akkermansia sp.]
MSRITGTLAEWRLALRKGEVSPTELVNQVADAIESSDGDTHAYLSFDREAALELAKNVDPQSPLAGIPVAVKDNINVLGQPTRCASRLLDSYVSPYDATAIRLMKESGGIPLGRLNMDEFAMGSTGENSAYTPTLNPHAPSRVPGGSSSGAAASVAAGTALASLGSDTGGSIRQPASHCGVVGIKPTYGRVSRYGLVAFASSLDQIGPITRNVEDAAIMLSAICGHDAKDSTSSTPACSLLANEAFEQAIGKDIKGLRIGIPKEYRSAGNHPGVTAGIENSLRQLESLGAEIIEISLPHAEAAVATYYIIACAEASSNLSRFDGIRYGCRAEDAQNLVEVYEKTRDLGFGSEVKRRIILGTYVLSSGYYDAYYARAQKVRALVAQDFAQAFDKVDLVVGPTAPTPAPKVGASSQNRLQTYLADIYTIPANLTGLPGISLPCGLAQEDGLDLPVGFQMLAPHFREDRLLSVGFALEKALGHIISPLS